MNPYACALYNCKSLNKLHDYLYINDKKYFTSFAKDIKDYPFKFFKQFKIEKIKDDGTKDYRELFICNQRIKSLHKRLIKLFDIEKSIYLKSGVKKQSHITNVGTHSNSNFFLLIDIQNFYPSITKSKIKNQLIRTYKQSSNVAEFIANSVTVPQEKSVGKRALVTGSVLSQFFAYAVNKKMFDELFFLSNSENMTFSVYVDDITFSSKKIITYKFHQKVYNIIKKYGYSIHNGKVFRGKISSKSKITGVHITKYGFRLLPKHKAKIRDLVKNNDIKKQKNLLGLLHYAVQVNPKYTRYKKLIEKYYIAP